MFYVGISEFSAVFSVLFQSLQLLKFTRSRFSSGGQKSFEALKYDLSVSFSAFFFFTNSTN